MESHGKSNTWSWVSLQSCFLTTPQGDHSAPTGLEVSRVACTDCLFKSLFPSIPPLISIPQTEPLSLCLYDCVPVQGIRFDAAVYR